jgi:hypothetical protein
MSDAVIGTCEGSWCAENSVYWHYERNGTINPEAKCVNFTSYEPEVMRAQIAHLRGELSLLHDTIDNFMADNGFTAENGYEDYDREGDVEAQLARVTAAIRGWNR